jgi:hypothetical protein
VRALPPGLSLAELTANLGDPPPEIIARARELRKRHLTLQIELSAAMLNIERQSQLSSDGGSSFAKPVYIDRKV